MGLDISVTEHDSGRIVKAAGEVDLSTSPDLRAAILKSIESEAGVLVDLSDVQYMDSSGVATLVEGLKSCSEKELAFALLKPSEPVMKVLRLARLDALFEIRDHVDLD